MAGMGKRMRPHTLSIPKPLIKVAGKPIVMRLVQDIVKSSSEKVDEIAFIIGDFGPEIEKQLVQIAESMGAKGTIYYQDEPLGTAHAILCAADSLRGKVVVAFADTLFQADFVIDESKDGTIWVHEVENPSAFGVVTTDEKGYINGFVEKPVNPVSKLAIIGIYYFRDGEYLLENLKYLTDNNIVKGGEYQLTDALQNMMADGTRFTTGAVNEWLDCGNKDATVHTNQRILQISKNEYTLPECIKSTDSLVINPCFIGKNVEIKNSVIGPNVSIGDNTKIEDSVIKNSIIQESTQIRKAVISNSMIGSYVSYEGKDIDSSIGDYTSYM